MKLYGTWLNTRYEGFGLEEDLSQVTADYANTPVVITELGSGDADTIRNLADLFTCLNDGGSATPQQYNITGGYTLTPAGQTFWDSYL